MFFRKKKNQNRHILRLGVTINITGLTSWLKSERENIPVVPYSKWASSDNYEYLIFVLPAEENTDWYFHKSAAEFSHSVDAIIDIESQFPSYTDVSKLCNGLTPDLEIELWNGMFSISFCRKLLLIAPLHEAINLMSSNKTSNGSFMSPQIKEIDIPITFNEKWEATDFMQIQERLDGRGAGYSNQLAHFWLDVPKGPVVLNCN